MVLILVSLPGLSWLWGQDMISPGEFGGIAYTVEGGVKTSLAPWGHVTRWKIHHPWNNCKAMVVGVKCKDICFGTRPYVSWLWWEVGAAFVPMATPLICR